jgi:peptidoglycan hydrolase-like protein with peptidoglycan-binding domain
VSLVAGTNTTVSFFGSGSFFINSNSNSNVAAVQLNGSTVLAYGLIAGTTNVSICQGSSAYCTTLYVTVTSAASTSSTSSTAATTTTTPVTYFSLTRYLGPGDKGDDVLSLQNALVKIGLLSATPNGYYGAGTTAAIKKFQKNYSINQTGNVGPSTKTALEKLKISITSDSTETQMAQLEALIASLKR